jgi:hypothetical protein
MVVGRFAFSDSLRGFEFFLLPSRVHTRPSGMLHERKPLGGRHRESFCAKENLCQKIQLPLKRKTKE